jgi:very-short-patch-repair endonuclease
MVVGKQKFIARARALRANQTDAEQCLWSKLRSRQLDNCKFVRQLQVGPYFADFACRERDLIVELDGGQHAGSQADERRTAVLAEHGYRVIRFWNNDVLTNIEGVLQMISQALAKAPSPGLRFAKPDLSPEGRGEEGNGSVPTSPFGGEVAAQRRVRGPA